MESITAQRASLEHARWLAQTADTGWLTTFEPRPVRHALGGPVTVRSRGDGRLLLELPAGSPHIANLRQAPAATVLLCEPVLGARAGRDAASVLLFGRVMAGVRGLSRAGGDESAGAGEGGGEVEGLRPFRLDVTGAVYRPRQGTDLIGLEVDAPGWLSARAPLGPPSRLARLVEHLNTQHSDELRGLVEGDGSSDASSVLIGELRPNLLRLSVLAPHGVTEQVVRLAQPVATPGELALELLRRLGRLGWRRCTRLTAAA